MKIYSNKALERVVSFKMLLFELYFAGFPIQLELNQIMNRFGNSIIGWVMGFWNNLYDLMVYTITTGLELGFFLCNRDGVLSLSVGHSSQNSYFTRKWFLAFVVVINVSTYERLVNRLHYTNLVWIFFIEKRFSLCNSLNKIPKFKEFFEFHFQLLDSGLRGWVSSPFSSF